MAGAAGWRSQRARSLKDPARLVRDPRVLYHLDLARDLTAAAARHAGPAVSGLRLTEALGLHHDGADGSVRVTTSPYRSGPASETGLGIEMSDFAGSYMSVTLDLPSDGAAVSQSSIIALSVEFSPPDAAPQPRLNLKWGADIERPQPWLTWLPEGVYAEFELSDLPLMTSYGGWIDLLFPPLQHAQIRVTALGLAHWLRLDV
ncbi:MAG: DUF6478 family protein [Pseudomonadota bacterium]